MTGDIAHICNRGVNKQNIFLEETDYLRFLEDLYKFNNKGGAIKDKFIDLSKPLPKQDKIIEILKWSLLPNHYHLLIYENIDGGIVEFVKRLGNGYTKYFNIKNERSGYLFQNSAKILRIQNERHLLYIPLYIETNPLDLHQYDWRENGLTDDKEALSFLNSYRWSSYRDYHGTENFPSIINQEMYFNLFETTQIQYEQEMREWLKHGRGRATQINLPGWLT